MVTSTDNDDNATRNSSNHEVVMIHYTPSRPPPLPEPPPWFHFDASIDGDSISILIFLFRLVYRVDRKYCVHDQIIGTFDGNNYDNNTIAITQQVVLYCYQDKNVWYDNNSNIHLTEDNGNFSMLARQKNNDVDTTSIANTQSALYQAKCKIIRPFYLMYDNDNDDDIHVTHDERMKYDDNTSTTIATMQLVVVLNQHASNETRGDNGGNDTLNINVLVVLFQIKYKRNWPTITINGELNWLFRSAYRIDRMYQIDKILSLIVLLPQPGPPQVQVMNKLLLLLLQVQVMIQVMYQNDTLFRTIYQGIDHATGIFEYVLSSDDDSDTSIDGDLISILIFLFRLVYRPWFHSNTSIYGELILSATTVQRTLSNNIPISLFRLAYRVDITFRIDTIDDTITGDINMYSNYFPDENSIILFDDMKVNNNDDGNDTSKDNNRDKDDTIIMSQIVVLCQDVHEDQNTIATMQLVVFHLAVHDNNNDNIASMQLLFPHQDNNVLPSDDRYEYATTSTEDDRNKILYGGYYLVDNTKLSTSINGEKYTGQSKYKDDHIKCPVITTEEITTEEITTENSISNDNTTEDLIIISSLDRNKILNGEYYFVLSTDALTNTTEELANPTEDLITIISSLDRNKILNGEYYFVLSKDALTNNIGDQNGSIMAMIDILLYQDVHDDRCGYSTTTIVTIAIIQLVLYQDKYVVQNIDSILIHPLDFIKNNGNRWYNNHPFDFIKNNGNRWYNNNNNNNDIIDSTLIHSFDFIKDDGYFSTSINGEKYISKYTSQSKYKDNYIKCQAPANATAARIRRMKLTPTTEDSSSTDNFPYRMKLTATTEDSSSTNNKTEDTDSMNRTENLIDSLDMDTTKDMDTIKDINIKTYMIKESISSKEDKNNLYNDSRKNGEEKRLEEKYQSRALRSEGQYKDEVYNAEEGMFQEPWIKNNDYDNNNIMLNDNDYCNSTMRENGEQTTCYSNQDSYMIQFCHNVIAIDSKDDGDMIATDASLRLGHSKEKIDINETTALIRTTRTSIDDETTTLIITIQNGEKNNQLDYDMVTVLIYDQAISIIPVQLCLCILLIVTLRLLSQSMGSVKIHKAQVKRASQLNQASQMRARLESGLVNQTSHESFGFAHPLFGSFFYVRSRIPL
ncbi:hypothetical protein FRACYDRAFT_250743 [Fragilariopsis cylindrus CCMP1102]|uniref:Uncharacterized protein n=1 Tax=Fragilariopsis cylindrus CCMP1102 TaxID=635003 RepID=A0A1E7EP41_9STRA|nr:hypothetical protein FRACYDRAFT_250743 [Fragilariopsis cylindrus CCMP1102]|eukprot:OEU07720.1 hypothetical protein FRACYDRAFT_250743 [Fragilariopsis cylindrus CCMP1102]